MTYYYYYDDNSDRSSDSSYIPRNGKSSSNKKKIQRLDDEGNIQNVDVYPTSIVINGSIRNAVTGHIYRDQETNARHLVGSVYEDLYFKVKLAYGERNSDNVLFYDSPAEFELHQGMILDEKIKENWKEKMLKLRLSLLASQYHPGTPGTYGSPDAPPLTV